MRLPVYLLTKPSNIFMSATVLTFAAWALPTFGLDKGFAKRAPLDPVAILILATWHILIFVAFRTGELFGKSPHTSQIPSNDIISLDSNTLYYIYTAIAAVGLATTTAKIIGALSLSGAIDFVLSGQANQLKEAIYDDYHIGLMSLRYVAAYPASVALYRLIKRRRFSIRTIADLLLLLLVATMTGRLLVIATVETTILLLYLDGRYVKIRLSRILLLGAILFSLLSAFNVSRNYGYYHERDLGFWSAGFVQIITYLSCSPQVALGTAARTDDLVAGKELTYRELVDVEPELNAVSAFTTLHAKMGYWCWLYISAVGLSGGYVFTRCLSYGRTAYLLPCGVILYAASDLWRLDLYSQGLFIALMVIGFGVPLALSAITPSKKVTLNHQGI